MSLQYATEMANIVTDFPKIHEVWETVDGTVTLHVNDSRIGGSALTQMLDSSSVDRKAG
jgi:hypothetical protein